MPNEHRADPIPPPHHGQGRGGSKKESFSLRVSPALHPPERSSPRRADMAGRGLGRETRERRYTSSNFFDYSSSNLDLATSALFFCSCGIAGDLLLIVCSCLCFGASCMAIDVVKVRTKELTVGFSSILYYLLPYAITVRSLGTRLCLHRRSPKTPIFDIIAEKNRAFWVAEKKTPA